MMRLRLALVAAAVAGAGLPMVALPASPVCAGETARAVLVVDTGEGGAVSRYCVALPKAQVSGIELIRLANEQHGLQYRLGFGGGAVCRLAGVGPDSDDCFAEHPNFWGYWRQTSAGWTWSSSGAGSSVVKNGSVEGWAWGSGQDGDSHPKPPATSFGSVCPPQPEPDGSPSKAASSSGGRDEAGGSGGDGPSSGSVAASRPAGSEADGDQPRRPRGNRGKPAERGKATGSRVRQASSPSASPSPPTAGPGPAATGPVSSPGPPAVGIAGITGAGLLVAGTAVMARRRRRSGTD